MAELEVASCGDGSRKTDFHSEGGTLGEYIPFFRIIHIIATITLLINTIPLKIFKLMRPLLKDLSLFTLGTSFPLRERGCGGKKRKYGVQIRFLETLDVVMGYSLRMCDLEVKGTFSAVCLLGESCHLKSRDFCAAAYDHS